VYSTPSPKMHYMWPQHCTLCYREVLLSCPRAWQLSWELYHTWSMNPLRIQSLFFSRNSTESNCPPPSSKQVSHYLMFLKHVTELLSSHINLSISLQILSLNSYKEYGLFTLALFFKSLRFNLEMYKATNC